MKADIRLPTTQYGYIEFHVEGEADEIIAEHNRLVSLYASNGEGISDKEYNTFIDEYMSGKHPQLDVYVRMNQKQQDAVQVIKKSIARLKAKE